MGQKAAQLTRSGAQERSMTQRMTEPIQAGVRSLPPWSLSPTPKYAHMPQSISGFQSSLSRKPVSCLHTPCQAQRKSKKVLKSNFPFAPRRQTSMKRPWRRVACTLGQRRNGGGQGLSGTRSLPKGQDLPGRTLWATGGERDGAEGEALQSSKGQKRSKE